MTALGLRWRRRPGNSPGGGKRLRPGVRLRHETGRWNDAPGGEPSVQVSDAREAEALDALAGAARAGDRGAREELLYRTHAHAFRWALVHTGDPDDADDVAQEVLVTVHRRLDAFRGQARFTTWLYRVTQNAAAGFHRRRVSRWRTARLAASEGDDRGRERDPAERVADAGLAELVREFFRDLPMRQRATFDLVDLQGYTPLEAAEMLGMKPATARAHLFKARRTIRARILELDPALAEECVR